MQLKVIATGSAGNCYALLDGHQILLLDAGINAGKILSGIDFRIGDVLGCLITHKHNDHCKGAKDLERKGVTFYGGIGTEVKLPFLRTSTSAFRLGQFQCLSFPVEHTDTDGTDCPNVGWLITNTRTKERMVYVTDACTLHNTFPGVNYWLVECNYMDELLDFDKNPWEARIPKSHMSLKGLCEVLSKNNLIACKQIVLCHCSEHRLDPVIAQRTILEATSVPTVVAQAGLMVGLEMEPY